jgi:long-chain acyl-CoA synthetase
LKFQAEQRGITLILFSDLIANSPDDKAPLQEWRSQVGLNNIFTVSYTSGTTQNSKGVVITNKNFVAALTNIRQVGVEFTILETDSYISYLPLAHVFDRLGVYSCMSVGASIGFFGGDLLKIPEDLQLLRPTIFASVPRLLNKVYDRIFKTV